MNPDQPIPQRRANLGRSEAAQYREAELPQYRDNPLLEALPPILSVEDAVRQLSAYPPYDPADRHRPAHLRLHLLEEVLWLRIPLPIHFELEQRFSRMIRSGYRDRNPRLPGFWPTVNQRVESLKSDGGRPPMMRSTANGFGFLGVSGIGKTTAIDAVLSGYPQVIQHTTYRGSPFTHTQLVWLKLECPYMGSVRGLCLDFLDAVDACLHTNYVQHYSAASRTVDQLLLSMARVASVHSLGMLAIDEIQHLCEAKLGGAAQLLNYLVQLVNRIALPVVLVGTYKAQAVLRQEFRQARRASGEGDLSWNRMTLGADWEVFVKGLWRYQYIQHPSPSPDQLGPVLYDVSQRITDIAVKVFIAGQARAITTGSERLTEGVIRSVFKDHWRLVAPALQALRSGHSTALEQFEDVYPKVPPFSESSRRPSVPAMATVSQEAAGKEQVAIAGDKTTTRTHDRRSPFKKVHLGQSPQRRRAKTVAPDTLMGLVKTGQAAGQTAYQTLNEHGVVRPITEFLPRLAS